MIINQFYSIYFPPFFFLEAVFFFGAAFFFDATFFFDDFFLELVFFLEATFFFGAFGKVPMRNRCFVLPSTNNPDSIPFFNAVLKYELNNEPPSFPQLIWIHRAIAGREVPFLSLIARIAFTIISEYVSFFGSAALGLADIFLLFETD